MDRTGWIDFSGLFGVGLVPEAYEEELALKWIWYWRLQDSTGLVNGRDGKSPFGTKIILFVAKSCFGSEKLVVMTPRVGVVMSTRAIKSADDRCTASVPAPKHIKHCEITYLQFNWERTKAKMWLCWVSFTGYHRWAGEDKICSIDVVVALCSLYEWRVWK